MIPKKATEIQTVSRDVYTDLSLMAALVENQLSNAMSAFERRDPALARATVDGDRAVNEYDRKIERGAMDILGSCSGNETALREIVTAMKLAGDLERVGDLAKNIAKRTLVLSVDIGAYPSVGVSRMGRVTLRQFSDVLNAFSVRDLDAALAVWHSDDEVDELYNSVFREIIQAMMASPENVTACTHLVFIAKNLERVGDHATNIAEAIYFLMTGEPLDDERPKGDLTSTTTLSLK